MDDIQAREWCEMESAARILIREAYHGEEGGVECLARILVEPSFSTQESWRLHRRNLDDPVTYCVRWIFWDQNHDFQRVMTPDNRLPVERRYRPRTLEPIIETGEAELPAAVAEALLRRLASTTLPCYAPQTDFGLDGTTYQLRTGDDSCGVEYTWWETPPEPWLPLQETVDALLEAFRKLVPESASAR